MSANLTLPYLLMVIAVTVIVIGVAGLLGPGEAILMIAVTLPFTLALLFVHEQHITAIHQCTHRYLSYMKSHK